MKTLLGIFGTVATIAAVVVGVFLLVAIPDRISCHKKSEMMGMESDYGLMTGCMVRVDDRYFPRESIRLVNGEVVVDMADD